MVTTGWRHWLPVSRRSNECQQVFGARRAVLWQLKPCTSKVSLIRYGRTRVKPRTQGGWIYFSSQIRFQTYCRSRNHLLPSTPLGLPRLSWFRHILMVLEQHNINISERIVKYRSSPPTKKWAGPGPGFPCLAPLVPAGARPAWPNWRWSRTRVRTQIQLRPGEPKLSWGQLRWGSMPRLRFF